ncbi:gamma-glutamyl-gamma-aminobutyrate hydrolase family protein [Leucobacter sp. gxy201]|uniref:gamma-glutamyl-gamma-aminobutyrate hydrolase family protein n=1 Tax=Leucobacter sp. gxy201 TaxID=2957200 RepID=UPI003DA123BE
MIGIPVPLEQASWRVWEGQAHLLSLSYTQHLQSAGATVVLIPVPTEPRQGFEQDAADVVSRLDGLVLAGGADIDPARYGADVAPESGPFDGARDAWEAALIEAAISAGAPVFGICRGLQLLNVVLGGTLIQHLPAVVGSAIHNPARNAFGEHRVRTVEGSWLRGAIHETADVATYHHQAIDELGRGLVVTAHADDGTIEGIEDQRRGLIGVQWHPEAKAHGGVFRSFVKLCETRREQPGEAPTASAEI